MVVYLSCAGAVCQSASVVDCLSVSLVCLWDVLCLGAVHCFAGGTRHVLFFFLCVWGSDVIE